MGIPAAGTVIGIGAILCDKGVVIPGAGNRSAVAAGGRFGSEHVALLTVARLQAAPGDVIRHAISDLDDLGRVGLIRIQPVETHQRRGIVRADTGLGVDDLRGHQHTRGVIQIDRVAVVSVDTLTVDNVQVHRGAVGNGFAVLHQHHLAVLLRHQQILCAVPVVIHRGHASDVGKPRRQLARGPGGTVTVVGEQGCGL